MDEASYTYNGKFEGDILIVGRTGCGKTTFVQNLGENKLSGHVNKVFWGSKVEISKNREDNMRDCFIDQTVHFEYPNDLEEFDDLLELFTRKKLIL